MKRFLLAASVVILVAVAAAILRDDAHARGGADPDAIQLAVGDRVEIAGTGVGCIVTRPRAQNRRTVLDCRRAGVARGTYGVLMGDRNVVVVRFRSATTAKVVFSARHGGSFRRCA